MNGVAVLCGRFGLGWLVVVMAGLVALNTMGGAAGNLASTSRLPFVAGIDLYLPPAFGKIHPRFRTPWVALGVYGLAGMVVAALGQAGTTVRGAYDVLVSMAIIANFIPFLVLFAAMALAQRKPAGVEVQRVPGGRPMALAMAATGFATTTAAILLAMIPASEEPNKPLAVAKLLVSTLVLIGSGAALFLIAQRKRKKLLEERSAHST
jgi:amino acid transporter